MTKGTADIEPVAPREATTGFPLTLAELSAAGFARSAGGVALDLRTGAVAAPPAGAPWTEDAVTFQGLRFRVQEGRLRVEGGSGEHLATVTAFATGVAVAAYPNGQLELLGKATPNLGCLFGDRVTELAVCEERHLTTERYRGLFEGAR